MCFTCKFIFVQIEPFSFKKGGMDLYDIIPILTLIVLIFYDKIFK